MKEYLKELWDFGWKHALCCVFPVAIFISLACSKLFEIQGLPRYDFLLLACVIVQLLMVLFKLETRDELLVITLFHVLGLTMEWFKVTHGSWSYPEFAYTKFLGVPLYSGFMYASVASFMCQAWRRLDLQMIHWPKYGWGWILAIAIYVNFFSHHYFMDLRWPLVVVVLVVFARSRVYFTTIHRRWMPVSLSFFLIGFFIWLAENIATFFGAWKYTYQHDAWKMVSLHKVLAWSLMAIVSYIIVAQLKFAKQQRADSALK
jgi:uncharacterized membrane protein YoaT (DUF817 family)